MNKKTMKPDDPRLTAYALGELTEDEAAEVRAAIDRDPALQAEVDAIHAMTGNLESALAAEPLPETEPVELAEQIEFPMNKRAPRGFPYFWVSGLAAAGFAVLVMVQSPDSPMVGKETIVVSPQIASPSAAGDGQSASAPTALERATESSDPQLIAEDMLLADADFSEKSRFEIEVTPEPAPLPPLTIPSNTGRLETVTQEKLLSAATAVRLAQEELPRPQWTSEIVAPNSTEQGEAVVIELSPFTVDTKDETAYAATTTFAGGRISGTTNEIAIDGGSIQPNSMILAGENTSAGKSTIQGQLVVSGSITPTNYFYSDSSSPATLRTRVQLADKSGFGSLMLSGNNTAWSHPRMATRRIVNPEVDSAEDYAPIEEEGWKRVADEPLSTFAVDVDSASYANVRRFLRGGQLPPVDAVKVEELINAFTYRYAAPGDGDDAPLMANLEVAAAPWQSDHRLVRIGLKAKEMPTSERAAANLVFLLDVSGSMNSNKKLPLVKEAMRLLLGQLRSDDRVAIVTYAGHSGLALPSTLVSDRQRIEAALRNLRSGGSTNGAMGIHLAYDIAKANFVEGGVNRVILCTDGDFNVGTTGLDELGDLISNKAESDVFLTALGFGMGNYQDDTLERLANRGNGHHGYIDSVREARRLLVEQVDGTLNTIARDVKVQVEFNPAQVAAYRLIGYDNRRLANHEFNDDSVDAGEIGAGHTVTALYEVVPAGMSLESKGQAIDPLRYQTTKPAVASPNIASTEFGNELLNVKVRAQPPEGGESRKWEFPLVDSGRSFEHASSDFKFAAAVAGFGLVLRDHPSVASTSFAQVEQWARSGLVTDPGGYRLEFIELVERADQLRAE